MASLQYLLDSPLVFFYMAYAMKRAPNDIGPAMGIAYAASWMFGFLSMFYLICIGLYLRFHLTQYKVEVFSLFLPRLNPLKWLWLGMFNYGIIRVFVELKPYVYNPSGYLLLILLITVAFLIFSVLAVVSEDKHYWLLLFYLTILPWVLFGLSLFILPYMPQFIFL